jgi:polyhydroxyalkanoate synthase
MVSFAARQWLDTLSPSNTLMNPLVLRQTASEHGVNLLRGGLYAVEDAWREAIGAPPPGAERYRIGVEVACTPGRVVLHNRLMELLQYTPTTPSVHSEPILIVPAWIMKYYVLDLEAHNSLVRFLVDQGFSVFCISWKNPSAEERDLSLEDYRRLGVEAAIDAIRRVTPDAGIHAVGYCLGGTLLAAAAAALGRGGSTALRSLTLLAAQTDFTEPGELSLFVDESQVTWLENQMAVKGYLDKRQMRATFELLRSRDLVWSYRLVTYLLGRRLPVNALMAWNADGTRMPARMHADYLRAFYLDNALAHGEYRVAGMPIHLADLRGPLFVVGAVQDHVAPWRSVFRIHQLVDDELTFVLTAGGHNVGIVNPPGDPRSSFRIAVWRPGERLLTPDDWVEATAPRAGSWWLAWRDWLRAHSSSRRVRPRLLPALAQAPGSYVHGR